MQYEVHGERRRLGNGNRDEEDEIRQTTPNETRGHRPRTNGNHYDVTPTARNGSSLVKCGRRRVNLSMAMNCMDRSK